MTTRSTPAPISRTLQVCGVLVLAVVVRVAACIVWSDDLTRDRDVYLGIAQGIADGCGFCTPGSNAPTAYRPPLYPLLLAAGLTSMPPAMATAVVNVLAGVATVLATWGLARRMSESAAPALIAATIVALDPLLIRHTAQPMTECVFAALVAAVLWMLSIALRPPHSLRIGVLCGVLLGLAALCRPTIWPFAALVIAITIPRKSQAATTFLALLAGFLLAVAPWAIRNTIVFGRPIVTTTHGGYTLLLANNPVFYNEVARQPSGAVWTGDSLKAWQQSMLAEAAAELGPGASEIEMDRWQAAQARRHIRNDPSGFANGMWYRVRSFWSLLPRRESLGPWGWLVAIWYAGLFVAAAVGLWRLSRRDLRWSMVLFLLIAAIQAVHLFYWTDTRMRAPLHPALAVLAAMAVTKMPRTK